MHNSSTITRGLSLCTWAAVLLCMGGAASCSQSSTGSSHAPDGAVDSPLGAGGAAGATSNSTDAPSPGGATSTVSASATTTSPGGTTGTGGATRAGGAGSAGTSSAGGVSTGAATSLRAGGVGGGTLGGSHASGGVATSGAAGTGGNSATLTGSGGSALGGSAAGGSKPDAGIATTPDASVRSDGPPGDMPTYRDFSVLIAGTWLVGRSNGEARQYSWVRLGGRESGKAEYLSGASLPSNTPFYACDGQATWNATAAPYAIMLDFPASCPTGLQGYFVFRAPPDTALAPPGATFGMVDPANSSTRPITEWWRYPDDQCDATMSTCKNPF